MLYFYSMIPVSLETREALILGQDRFVWEIPAFEKRARGRGWYGGMLLIAVFLVAYAIYTANFLFAFLVLLTALLLLLTGHHEPANVLVQIGDNGLVWNGKLYLFQDMDNFSIIYQPPQTKVLYLETRHVLTPRLRIPLADQDPLQIRDHLKRYLPEDADLRGEHFSDIVGRLLKI